MILTAVLETIETGVVHSLVVECQDYTDGFEQLQRTLPSDVRLVSVRPGR